MKAEWGEAEKRALNEKLNHPQKLVKCPRCGSELVYEKRGNSIAERLDVFMEESEVCKKGF